MRAKLTKSELQTIESLYAKVNKLWRSIDDEKDVALQNDNGTVSSQLGCASAALWTILQDFE